MNYPRLTVLGTLALAPVWAAFGQVVLSEIHYNPVEKAAFSSDGTPVLDLSSDVHEFVKLHNAGTTETDLGGWKLAGGIEFTFPAGTKIPPGAFFTVAKNPARLTAVYAGLANVLGPYVGQLKNSGDTVRLERADQSEADSATYDSKFPWSLTANKLGAGDEWTLQDSSLYQYKGRSLQRVSATWSGDDPANWIASPALTSGGGGPNPGGPNAVTRATPKPVAVGVFAVQESTGSRLIRADQAIKVLCAFSSGAAPTNAQVEYFVDGINGYDEPKATVPLTGQVSGQFAAIIPGQALRSLIRYRILGDRGDGMETISPRADDPVFVPISATAREAWHSCFITPERAAPTPPNVARPIYDCFISTVNKASIDRNANQSPKRVTNAAATGVPRALPYVAPTAPIWNATVPAVFVHDGVVYDIQIRHHGSRYNRGPGRNSYKVQYLDFQPFQGRTSNFITDKSDIFITCHGLFRAANLPISDTRWVEWYFNNTARLNRLEQGEYDGDLLDEYHQKMERITPGATREASGEYYKSVGSITLPDGPYGRGDEGILVDQKPTATFAGWTALQKYDWTYALQNHSWKGALPIKQIIESMWAARGTTDQKAPPVSLPDLRAWFAANWDVETTLTSMAVANWMCPWDDTTQNHFLWRKADGKWSHLLWDFDAMYGTGDNTPAGSSIFIGEVGNKNNNSRGPNFVKDSLIKAYREEFTRRIWFIANTLCDPENLESMTYITNTGATKTFRSQIGAFVNTRRTAVNNQTVPTLGIFYKPTRPLSQQPSANGSILKGASLAAAAYAHSNTEAPKAHASSRWEIRRANDTYDDPAHVEITKGTATSIPIPVEKLKFGRSYLWRVTYVDADGHPSVASAETAFTYGAAGSGTSQPTLVISEILTDNRSAIANGGRYPDYIELRNNTASPILLEGKSLTDDPLQPQRYTFPAGTTIPANGYLLVWCDADTAAPGLHTGFALSRDGQTLLLLDGSTILDTVTFGPQAPDAPLSRHADGTWQVASPSPSGPTGEGAALGSKAKLVINEWLADPSEGAEDWFEIYNADDKPVSLEGLYVSDSFWNPTTTKLPPLSFIKAKGHVRLLANGSNDGADNANFKLSGSGESIVLTDGDGVTVLSAVTFGRQTPGVSQGRQPDGAAAIVSFPNAATPGEANPAPAAGDADGDGLPDAFETANGLNPASSADALLDKDSDGQSNRAEYIAGTDVSNPASVFTATFVTAQSGLKLRFAARAGKDYTIEVSEDLRGNTWKKVSDVPAPAADGQIEVEVTRGAARQFYRVVTPPRG